MSTVLRRSLMAAAFAAACASNLTLAQSQAVTPAGYPAPGAPATIAVSSAGAEPRTRLRYKVAAGQSFVMSMSTTIGMTMNMEGMSLPAMDLPIMRMLATLAVKNVAENGDITYDMAFTEMTAEALPGMDPNVAAMVQGAASAITALKGTVVVTDRGVTKSAGLDVNQITDPSLRQTLSSLSSQLESMSVPLPEEAIGVGAKWEVRQAINGGGIQLFQRIETEVTSVDASSVTIRMRIEQTAPAQSINNPSLPAGATVDIERMSGTGSGTMTLRFDNLVPTSELASTTGMAMVLNLGGQTQRMAVDTKTKVTVAPKKN